MERITNEIVATAIPVSFRDLCEGVRKGWIGHLQLSALADGGYHLLGRTKSDDVWCILHTARRYPRKFATSDAVCKALEQELANSTLMLVPIVPIREAALCGSL